MQLDLFDSPPPLINPNKDDMVPDCFHNYKQYSDWLTLARAAKEECTICEDCQPDYQVKMKLHGRCHHEWHSVNLIMKGRFIKATQNKETKND